MALTNSQIERYSRQIVVPKLGGRGQERLLSSCVILAGELEDLMLPLRYLAAAGVGTIRLRSPQAIQPRDRLMAELGELNPEVQVCAADRGGKPADLVAGLVGSDMGRKLAAELTSLYPRSAFLLVRLDRPVRIAILPSPPPCPACANADLLAPYSKHDRMARFVAMVAAAEALKLLAGFARPPRPVLVEFGAMGSSERAIEQNRRNSACACTSGWQRQPG